MPNDFLDLDLRLLILKYGRPQVMQSLARLGNTTFEELEQRLGKLAKRPTARKRKEPLSPEAAVDRLEISDPLIKGRLLSLAREFERKRFLPDLRDAVRFCQQQGVKSLSKSRHEMLPRILAILATFPSERLDELSEHIGDGSGTSFARLADAIMKGT
jgi:hypothetical protein